MTIRLPADEKFPPPALLALRSAGVEFDEVSELMPAAGECDYGELVFVRKAAPPEAILYLRQGAYMPEWPAEAMLPILADPSFASGSMLVISVRFVRRRLIPTESA